MALFWDIIRHDTVTSTQDVLKELVATQRDFRKLYAVQALNQSDGRGRHGRKWKSLPGNLYLSYHVRPHVAAQKIGQLALICALAMAQTMENILPEIIRPVLKWPNDILLEGRKCCGILMESGSITKDGFVDDLFIGIGVNIAQGPDALCSTLYEYTKDMIGADMLRDMYLQQFSKLFEQWQGEGFSDISKAYLARCMEMGQSIMIKPGSYEISGYFNGIDEDGSLLLKQEDGETIRVVSGDVFLTG